MTAAARYRLLATAAAATLLVAGVVLERRQAASGPTPREHPSAARASATASAIPTPAAATTAPAVDAAVGDVARGYALAATNWSSRTYRAAYRRQLQLADHRLRRQLHHTRPTRVQLAQLAGDRQSRLGAVLATRRGTKAGMGRTTRVLVDIDELQIAAGRRSRRTVSYRIDLHRVRDAWRVSRFGVIGERRP